MDKCFFPQIVHTWMYGDVEFEKVAASLREAGADGADIGITLQGRKNGPEALERTDLRGILARENLKPLCVTPLCNHPELDLSHPDDKIRDHALGFAVRGLDIAVQAGSDRMMIPPTWFSVRQSLHKSYEEDFARATDSLARLAGEASRRRLLLLLEPINRFRVSLVHTVAEARRMLDAIGMDNLGIAGDTYHMNMEEGQGVPSAILAAGPLLRCLHIGENNRKPPGFGSLDWKAVLGALKAIGFSGPLSHEPVFLYFSEQRVASDPEYHRYFQRLLGHGIKTLRGIMEALDDLP
ncbi:MAG: sugar phosphate isomerase/epimerase [Planctomycetota bacterium]|jgi:D-psicose/D-tagatose/L-ribulose 3-epimerase|nr:sugar phosphate isomerase/epimerase [Planctomycetota bacterium]